MFKIIKEVGIRKYLEAGVKEIVRKIYLERILESYSQNKEDLLMEKILPKKGFYIEIGAYHPTRLSNTYRFYKKGWTGVVVEPNPDVKNLFKKLRPSDIFLNAGIGKTEGKLKYFRYLIPALNTFSAQQVKENTKYKVVESVLVKVIGVKGFLNKYAKKDIDLLSLDVEGWDREILENWDWKYKPKVICVEGGVGSFLESKGYEEYCQTRDNKIYRLLMESKPR